MPLIRYFVFVGGALLTLLFIANVYLPSASNETRNENHRVEIDVKSDKKWPEKVVYDTTLPTLTPPPSEDLTYVPTAVQPAGATIASSGNAMAQMFPAPSAERRKIRTPAARKLRMSRKSYRPMLAERRPPMDGFFSGW
jgi:hypothetical protein